MPDEKPKDKVKLYFRVEGEFACDPDTGLLTDEAAVSRNAICQELYDWARQHGMHFSSIGIVP